MSLPKVNFLGEPTSRMIVGCNPFVGFSYHSLEMDEEMMDYHTANRIAKTLLHAQHVGYTTTLLLADALTLRMLREYRAMGGEMKWIAQLVEQPLPPVLKQKPFAVYVQGGLTDTYIDNGEKQRVIDWIQRLKDSGVRAGMASHKPENIRIAEDEGWGAEFYMVSLHRKPDGHVSSAISGETDSGKGVEFVEGTRPIALETIRSIDKPCIAYKVFRGGYLARQTEQMRLEALKEVYAGIKPGDITVVGMYQKYKDQLQENSDAVCNILKNG